MDFSWISFILMLFYNLYDEPEHTGSHSLRSNEVRIPSWLHNETSLLTATPSWKYIFKLKGVGSQKCITVDGASTENNAKMVIWDCVDAKHQQWIILPKATRPNSFGAIIGSDSFKCLTDHGGSVENDTPVDQYDCEDPVPSNQAWNVVRRPDFQQTRQVQIVGNGNNKCVTVHGASSDNGAAIHIYDCVAGGASNQLWQMYH